MTQANTTIYPVARVMAQHRGSYDVENTHGQYFAKISGKFMFTIKNREEYPAVGDWVTITELPQNNAVIHSILPRKSILKKKYSNAQDTQIIATNIDVAFITEAMDRDYNLNRFERFLVLTQEANITPVIILHKTDLISVDTLLIRVNQIKERFKTIDVLTTSILRYQGIYNLEAHIFPGKTYCFLGSSGVGKSSLINALLGKETIKTREISTTERGKHTTTAREMYILKNGALLIDNPGVREVGITESSGSLDNVFEEIQKLSKDCKFSDCSHSSEPACAVLKAINQKELFESRYENYMKLKKESDFFALTELEKRKKDRTFGKFIKSALKDLK